MIPTIVEINALVEETYANILQNNDRGEVVQVSQVTEKAKEVINTYKEVELLNQEVDVKKTALKITITMIRNEHLERANGGYRIK